MAYVCQVHWLAVLQLLCILILNPTEYTSAPVQIYISLKATSNSLIYIVFRLIPFFIATVLVFVDISPLPKNVFFVALYVHPVFLILSSIPQFASIFVPNYLKLFTCPIFCLFSLILCTLFPPPYYYGNSLN